MTSVAPAPMPDTLPDVIQINPEHLRSHVDSVVRDTVEKTLNDLLQAEAEELYGAKRYERSPDRLDLRAGSYKRRAPHHGSSGRAQGAAAVEEQDRLLNLWRQFSDRDDLKWIQDESQPSRAEHSRPGGVAWPILSRTVWHAHAVAWACWPWQAPHGHAEGWPMPHPDDPENLENVHLFTSKSTRTMRVDDSASPLPDLACPLATRSRYVPTKD